MTACLGKYMTSKPCRFLNDFFFFWLRLCTRSNNTQNTIREKLQMKYETVDYATFEIVACCIISIVDAACLSSTEIF